MPAKLKATNETILESYKRLNNIWLVGKEIGMCGQSVWERLKKLDAIDKSYVNHPRGFKDWDVLKKKYPEAAQRKNGIQELADELGRTKNFICRKAKELGLTDINRPLQEHVVKDMSKRIKKYLQENEHPKGMLGKTHTKKTKKILSEKSKERWKDPNYALNQEEYRQNLSDRMTKFRSEGPAENRYSRTKCGWVEINEKRYFFRSSWEANFAGYLEFLKEQKQIKDWEYETETFWFEQIKRGVRSYTPDFKVFNNDDTTFFYEVKGWMDPKSKTKLNRMRIYHPEIRVDVIDSKRYKEISKSQKLFKHWGKLDNAKTKMELGKEKKKKK